MDGVDGKRSRSIGESGTYWLAQAQSHKGKIDWPGRIAGKMVGWGGSKGAKHVGRQVEQDSDGVKDKGAHRTRSTTYSGLQKFDGRCGEVRSTGLDTTTEGSRR